LCIGHREGSGRGAYFVADVIRHLILKRWSLNMPHCQQSPNMSELNKSASLTAICSKRTVGESVVSEHERNGSVRSRLQGLVDFQQRVEEHTTVMPLPSAETRRLGGGGGKGQEWVAEAVG